jgi:hypothetical protein
MRGYALSSASQSVVIAPADALAFAESMKRHETMWGLFLSNPESILGLDPETLEGLVANAEKWEHRANVDVVWNAEIGVVNPDPNLSVIQIVDALPPGTPPGVIAYHDTDELGRPRSLISYVAAGSAWLSAVLHEGHESRSDASCRATVRMPDGRRLDLETDDPFEGSDFPENGRMVSNSGGPRYFGLTTTGVWDLRQMAGFEPAMTTVCGCLDTGYRVIDGAADFGPMVSEAKKAYVRGECGRPGMRRKARGT